MRKKKKATPNYTRYVPKTVAPLGKVSWSFLVGANYSTPQLVLATAENNHRIKKRREEAEQDEKIYGEGSEFSGDPSRPVLVKERRNRPEILQTLTDLSPLEAFAPQDEEEDIPPPIEQDHDLQYLPQDGEQYNPDLVSEGGLSKHSQSTNKLRYIREGKKKKRIKMATHQKNVKKDALVNGVMKRKRRKPNEFYPSMKPLRSKQQTVDIGNSESTFYRTIEQLSFLDEGLLLDHIQNKSLDIKPALESMRAKKKMVYSENYKSFKPTGKSLTPYRHFTNYKAALSFAQQYEEQVKQAITREKQQQRKINTMESITTEKKPNQLYFLSQQFQDQSNNPSQFVRSDPNHVE